MFGLPTAPDKGDNAHERSIRARRCPIPDPAQKIRVRIVATPDSSVSPVTGLYETFGYVDQLTVPDERVAADGDRFDVEIVGESAGPIACASGLEITAHRSVAEVTGADIVIVPSMAFGRGGEWAPGRYPKLVRWLTEMHDGGATICSACTGANLTAETGLLNGREATVHWAAVRAFRDRYPDVQLRLEEVLVVSGDGGRLITSGAATAWTDLALHLIATRVGPATAQAMARFMLWQWHRDGQAPFEVFDPPTDHGDAAVLAAQRGIGERCDVAAPVDEMVRWSGLAPRTFKRRFKLATGYTPIAYVQRIRVERAKRMLESTREPIEDISWAVGYQDPASFRRLFKRHTGLTPGSYRQRFQIPVVRGQAEGTPAQARG